jgi:hypothetical protein
MGTDSEGVQEAIILASSAQPQTTDAKFWFLLLFANANFQTE